jgi:hypothetical protein
VRTPGRQYKANTCSRTWCGDTWQWNPQKCHLSRIVGREYGRLGQARSSALFVAAQARSKPDCRVEKLPTERERANAVRSQSQGSAGPDFPALTPATGAPTLSPQPTVNETPSSFIAGRLRRRQCPPTRSVAKRRDDLPQPRIARGSPPAPMGKARKSAVIGRARARNPLFLSQRGGVR